MLSVGLLPENEYGKLADIAEGFVPSPSFSRAIVVKEDGEIVGRAFLLYPVHIEGVWIREDRRNGLVLSQLVEATFNEARRLGLTKVLAFGMYDKMEDYLKRLKFKRLSWSVWNHEV